MTTATPATAATWNGNSGIFPPPEGFDDVPDVVDDHQYHDT